MRRPALAPRCKWHGNVAQGISKTCHSVPLFCRRSGGCESRTVLHGDALRFRRMRLAKRRSSCRLALEPAPRTACYGIGERAWSPRRLFANLAARRSRPSPPGRQGGQALTRSTLEGRGGFGSSTRIESPPFEQNPSLRPESLPSMVARCSALAEPPYPSSTLRSRSGVATDWPVTSCMRKWKGSSDGILCRRRLESGEARCVLDGIPRACVFN